MADTVSFKVYLSSDDDTDDVKSEVRRFGIDKDVVTSFVYLTEKLQTVFADLRSKRFTISWKDTDEDNIVISSDEELRIFLTETIEQNVRVLYVTAFSDCRSNNFPSEREQPSQTHHLGVVCDSCDKEIQGFRYKCIQCPDYDLCSLCEGKGLHPEHCMIRSAVPLQWKPHFGRRLAHHMNKFARKSGHAFGKEGETGDYPHKRGKFHEGNHGGPHGGHHGGHHEGHHEGHHGGHHRGHHGGPHGGHHGGPHGGHHGGPHGKFGGPHERQSWLDTLATYLNEWAYLPSEGECPMKDRSGQQTEGESDSDREKSKCKKDRQRVDLPAEFFKDIGQNLANLLDPLGINVQVSPDSPNAPAETSSAPAEKNPKQPETSTQPKFPGEGKKLVENTPTPDPTPSAPVDGPSTSVGNPSLEHEGWMLLNRHETSPPTPVVLSGNKSSNEPMETEIPTSVAAAPLPNSVPATIITSGPIYPELPKPTENSHPIYHSDPKIQRSVVAMMQMGFSNEGGWLTQLLASKDGEISKVLDILQPVRPVKK